MRKIIGLLLAGTFASVNAATDIGNKTITSIYTYNNYAVVEFTPKEGNDQNCSNHKAVYIDMSNEKGKSLYSSVLAAATAEKMVSFKGNNGCDPVSGALKIYRTRVKF